MMIDARTLTVRGLNETRLLHPPTYVASRYLADSIASDSTSSWLIKTITRRFPAQKGPRFFKFQRFKRSVKNNHIEYRDFLAPSPMTCLAEALVLQELSGLETFRKPSSVYSHCWPLNSSCPYNFDHYANGYGRRNADIASALRSNPRCVAIVSDIEKFYPSIPHQIVRQKFHHRLESLTVNPDIRATALNLFEHLVSEFSSGTGIATGPELSHVIGDIALSEVDEEFGRSRPGRYFRYVDDIVLIVEPEDCQSALAQLHTLLDNGQLKTNSDKADKVDSREWLSYGPNHHHGVREDSFEALVFRLKVFFALKPAKSAGLASALREHGFRMPIGRLMGAAGTSSFDRRIRMLARRRWKVLLNTIFATEKSLVDYALRVRRSVEQQLIDLFGAEWPTAGIRRKWHVQRVRHLANRALYLFPPNDLGFIQHALGSQPEFAETVALIKLLKDGDCSDLLQMPGAAVSAAAALLRSTTPQVKHIILPPTLSVAATHSAAILLLYGVAELQPSSPNALGPEAAAFLSFCSGAAPQHRERKDFSYMDEIRSLQLNRTANNRLEMLDNRFSESEADAFEALEIGEDYYC